MASRARNPSGASASSRTSSGRVVSSTSATSQAKHDHDGQSQDQQQQQPQEPHQQGQQTFSHASQDRHPGAGAGGGNDMWRHAVDCPYHGPFVSMQPPTSGQEYSAIGRFLEEGSGEQSALFLRPDTGGLSTAKGCSCYTYWTTGSTGQA